MNARRKLLWIGDAGVPSGFAKATHNILETICQEFDVTVLALNYRGDPHAYPYSLYAAAAGGDEFGVERLIWMCDLVKPDVIIIQNDGWNIPLYVQRLQRRLPSGKFAFPEYAEVPVVAIVAVDGKNFQSGWLKSVSLAVFWTQFALDEARAGGYTGPATVIPLGVDLEMFYPADKCEVRQRLIPSIADAFIVGNVNRNQPRKRWDLTIRYFARWVKQLGMNATEEQLRTAPVVLTDAFLYLHVAPTGDLGVNCKQLASYYGVLMQLALMETQVWYGVSDDDMRETYNCFDVQITTTQGEGMGLTTLEGMACGVPQIVPDWAALGEVCAGAALVVPCTSTMLNPIAPNLNVIGGVADEVKFVAALDDCYNSRSTRQTLSRSGLARASEGRFRWAAVGRAYVDALQDALGDPRTGVPAEGRAYTFPAGNPVSSPSSTVEVAS